LQVTISTASFCGLCLLVRLPKLIEPISVTFKEDDMHVTVKDNIITRITDTGAPVEKDEAGNVKPPEADGPGETTYVCPPMPPGVVPQVGWRWDGGNPNPAPMPPAAPKSDAPHEGSADAPGAPAHVEEHAPDTPRRGRHS
jgi:hypothetical protein